MAAICPNCHQHEAVAYVVNSEGIHPFPCMECNASTVRSNPLGTLLGAASCATEGCFGHVQDEYHYNTYGRLTRITRHSCRMCGTAKTGEHSHARGSFERTVPDPRLYGFQG